MNERIKELRKALGLTMERFGSLIGVGKNAISEIENGRNNVSDRLIHSICKTEWEGKWVSEEWLRNGNGDMFRTLSRNQKLLNFINQIMMDDPESFRPIFV